MKKIIIFITILMIGMVYSVSGTLIDSEDFESYNNATDLINNNHWGCSSPPSCKTIVGSGTAEYLIIKNASNNYLSMYASGYNPAIPDTSLLSLYRNTSTMSVIGSGVKYYTMQMDMKGFALYDAGLGSNIKNVGGNILESFNVGGVDSNFNPISAQYIEGYVIGHYYNNTVPSNAEWDLLRTRFNTLFNNPVSLPYTTSCDISDNQWHTITKIYKFNNTNLKNIRIYNDGVLCYNLDGSYGSFSGTYPFSKLDFNLRNNAILNIDNIKFYDSEEIPSPPPSTGLLDGLQAYWTFDTADISGNVLNDDSGNNHDATLIGNIVTGQSGVHNEAFYFDGTNGTMRIPYDIMLDPARIYELTSDYNDLDFTMSVWVKINSLQTGSGHGMIYGNRDWTSSSSSLVGNTIRTTNNYNLFCDMTDSSYVRITSTNPSDVANDTWVHYVCIYNSTQIPNGHPVYYPTSSYLDGVYYGETGINSINSAPYNIKRDFYIASNQNKLYYYKGWIDELAIWNRVLNATEIEQLDNGTFFDGFGGTNTSYECSDGVDNDGDGLIDYPYDPSCSSSKDDTEAPIDTTQCSDGIDNDGDGFIDLSDPSCSGSYDKTEYPRDDSPAEEDVCLVEEGCLLHDTFPYSDELNLHGWYGDIGSLRILNQYGSYKVYLDTDSDSVRFNISKNITNDNNYESVNSDAEIYIDIGSIGILSDDTNYTFYWEHLDYDDRKVNSLRFDISRVSSISPDFVKVKLFNYNGSGYEQIGNIIYPAHGSSSRIQFFLSFDQTLKTYNLEYLEEGKSIVTISDLPWADVLATKIYKTRFSDINSIDDSKVDVYIDDVSIYSNDVNYDSICDEWSLPYYLKESFNGYPSACDWSANLNIFFTGNYRLYKTTELYQQFKELPIHIEDDNTRYVTFEFDADINSFGEDGNSYIRLYDNDYQLIMTILLYEGSNDVILGYQEDGNTKVAKTGIPFNQSYNYKVIIDFQDDVYDIFYNGTEVQSNAGFYQNNYNLKQIGFVRIGSTLSDISLDNFVIYGSDENGNKIVPDDDNSKTSTVDETTTLCGIVHTLQPSCSENSDCDSNYCLPNNKCARWDANYCEDNGMVYGNKCFLAGITECTLKGAGNLITSHFLYFLVFLVLIMLVVYLTIMFRR